jgi:hypothetical protein
MAPAKLRESVQENRLVSRPSRASDHRGCAVSIAWHQIGLHSPSQDTIEPGISQDPNALGRHTQPQQALAVLGGDHGR